jgi:hypothetical protein
MKLTRVIAVLAILSLVVIPALGELTDYQKGAMDGMKAGLRMGKLLGAAPYDPSQAQEYNSLVDTFNQGLSALFGDNADVIKMFWMSPLSGYGTAAKAISSKPVHAIDGSWNQTNRTITGDVDTGRVYGMPASSYYTWVGTAPQLPYSGTTDAQGNPIYYDNMGGV